MNDVRITVRSARSDDSPCIAAFNRAMALETENKTLDQATSLRGVELALAAPAHARYYLAEADGQVVGQCMITYEWSDWRAGLFWWMQSVYVRPEYRGRGMFKLLFEHVRAEALESGNSCGLRLYVEEHNRKAIATYLRLGMKPSGHLVYEIDWS